jgi:hypothetical protein
VSNKCSTNDDDEGVSLRPSTSVRDDDAPALMTIRQFKPCGGRDDRLTIGSPLYARRGLETIVNATGRTNLNSVALWALARGLGRFAEWTEIETICAARATLLQCGSADLVQLDEWRYQLAARDGHTRLFLRCVSSADSGRCADRARGLGLSTSTYGALAIVAGIVDLSLPGDLPRVLVTELREFRRGLRRRAALADELAKRAQLLPHLEGERVSWDDIFTED